MSTQLFRSLVRWIDSGRSDLTPGSRAAQWIRVAPFVAVHLGCLLVPLVGTSTTAIVAAIVLYAVRMFGITAIYHRYFSHRAFRMSRRWQFVMAVLAASAGQRGPLWWAAHHRLHHAHADAPEDPHSPGQQGFWRSHMGWFFSEANFATQLDRVPDWANLPELRLLDRFDTLVPALLASALWVVGTLIEASSPESNVTGAQLVVWGFCISTVAVYHATFSINSCAHRFGTRRYATGDNSHNSAVLALLTLGEGWHNNHHRFPGSARQGFFWWELDLTYLALRGLAALGVVRALRPVPAGLFIAEDFDRRGSTSIHSTPAPRVELAKGTRANAAGTDQTLIQRAARYQLQRILSTLTKGELVITERGLESVFGQSSPGLYAGLIVSDPSFYVDVTLGGSIGAGESFMRGAWESSDLTSVMKVILRNQSVLERMETGWARLAMPARKFMHRLASNSRSGSVQNIAAHYDLGNDFFEVILGRAMMYSCVHFETEHSTLDEAEVVHLDRVCRKLELTPADHILEIGTGWGGFAVHAALHYGCRVTTATISQAQFEFARERVAAAGVQDAVSVMLCDYRDLQGSFDKLVSIEMVEHVGHRLYSSYFQKCVSLLRDGGLFYLQASTIAGARFEQALKSVDFIQRHIFPGCCIPSVASLCEPAGLAGLNLIEFADSSDHYVSTLRAWSKNLVAATEELRARGYSDQLIRKWMYYFSYCEAGFAEHALGAAQMLFRKAQL